MSSGCKLGESLELHAKEGIHTVPTETVWNANPKLSMTQAASVWMVGLCDTIGNYTTGIGNVDVLTGDQ